MILAPGNKEIILGGKKNVCLKTIRPLRVFPFPVLPNIYTHIPFPTVIWGRGAGRHRG